MPLPTSIDNVTNCPGEASAAARELDRTTPIHIRPLTALRGIAALLVVVFHYTGIAGLYLRPDAYTRFIGKSYLCVDLFFLLSGFVLAHVYRRPLGRNPSARDIWNFFGARFSRLYPAYLTVIGALVAVELVKLFVLHDLMHLDVAAFGDRNRLRTLPLNLLLLQSFGVVNRLTWDGPSWSVSAEWYTYLLLPLLLPRLSRLGRRAQVAVMGGAFAAVVILCGVNGSLDLTWNLGFLRCVPEFIAGAALYGCYRSFRQREWSVPDAVAAGGVMLVVFLMHVGANDALIVVAMSAMLFSLAANRQRVAGLLSARLPMFLGGISYSIYLIHMPLLEVEQLVWKHATASSLSDLDLSTISSALLVGGDVLAVVGAAALLNRFVEVPARARLRRALTGATSA